MPSKLLVRQTSALNHPENQQARGIASRLGIQVVEDFYTHMVLMGYAYQVRAGTITTPLVGDVDLTDTKCEYCVDAATALTIIPVYNNISIRLATGTLHEYAIKSVGAVSSAGTAFVPLLLNSGGIAVPSTLTARVAAAGGVTVTAEAVTTTRRHWSWSNPAAGATGALPTSQGNLDWEPRMPPVLQGPYCLYVQIAAASTGPSYYASLDFIAMATATIL